MATNNAKMYDLQTLIEAGIDPKTGLPIRMGDMADLSQAYYTLLKEMDRQDFVNKGTWYNLPGDLTGELLERILYYRGQGAFFYMKENDRFYFLPYALAGDIDVYGRYKYITPVAFGGVNQEKEDKAWIPGLKKKVVLDITKLDFKDFDDACVLLKDRSEGLSQRIIDRSTLTDPIIKSMSEVIPMCRTNLLSNCGIKGMKVNGEGEAANVKMASRAISKAAMSGDPWIPIVGMADFQDLTTNGGLSTEDYLSYFQALDNLRMKTHGFESGGIFEKKSHMLEDEQAMNSGRSSRVLDDTVKARQEFCTTCNILWGLDMWYEPADSTVCADQNMDGMLSYDESPEEQGVDDGN